MKSGILAVSAACVLLGAAGCASSSIRVYDPANAGPSAVAVPKLGDVDPRGEPAVCLFAWHGNHYLGELGILRDSGRFRSLHLLAGDALDPNGCGLLLSIRQGGSRYSMAGTSFVDAYSPYGGEQVLRAQAEGGWGDSVGFAKIARYLKAELQEGRPLRAKLDKLKGSKPLIDEDDVSKLAEGEPLTWDGLIAAADQNDKPQLEAAKEKAEAQAAAEDDKEDAAGDEQTEQAPASADAAKPWWAKP